MLDNSPLSDTSFQVFSPNLWLSDSLVIVFHIAEGLLFNEVRLSRFFHGLCLWYCLYIDITMPQVISSKQNKAYQDFHLLRSWSLFFMLPSVCHYPMLPMFPRC